MSRNRLQRTGQMKVWIRAILMIVAMSAISACATIAANHDFNPAVNFDRYETFSWVSAHPLVDPSPDVSPLLEGRIEQTARDLLVAKGYRFVDNADSRGLRRRVWTRGNRQSAYRRLSCDVPSGPWHWRGTSHDVTVRQYTEGRLVVDIFDVRSRQPAWHGWATKTLSTNDLKDPQSAIRSALTAILANFPPS